MTADAERRKRRRGRGRRPSSSVSRDAVVTAVAVWFVAGMSASVCARDVPLREPPVEGTTTTTTATTRETCANAHADARRIADDRGYACAWYELDRATGCCGNVDEAERFACGGCDASVECCGDYETCVTCCLGPTHDVGGAMKRHSRGRNQVITGFFDDAFAYCANRCRTQPSVTVHENSYAYSTAYCYGDYPKNEDPVPVKGKGKKSFAGDSPNES